MRNLVTIRKINEIKPIENADRLELALIDGWQTVVQKGEFKPNDLCVYFEIDSFIPMAGPDLYGHGASERFKFLENKAIKYDGILGTRIRTMKLRGTLSQGLAMPFYYDIFPEFKGLPEKSFEDGTADFASMLGVIKWEPYISPQLGGQVATSFPYQIHKTDQERLQNIFYVVKSRDPNEIYEVTEKIDGSSGTIYFNNEVFGVCSRNWELYNTENNSFWKVARKYKLEEKLKILGRNIAIQGELCGPGVQMNKLHLSEIDLYVFDIWNIDTQSYLSGSDRNDMCEYLDLIQVPVLEWRPFNFGDIDEAMEYAEGSSRFSSMTGDATKWYMREGLVWKSIWDPNFSFKIINNEYLLKHGE